MPSACCRWLAASLALLLTGCALAPMEPPPEPVGSAPSPRVYEHVWESLPRLGGETRGYGRYTYVIQGDSGADGRAAARFSALAAAIQSSTATFSELGGSMNPIELNVFLIPAAPGRPEAAAAMSRGLRTLLSASSGNPFRDVGPYLISVREPLMRKATGLLYADLSRIQEPAFSTLLNAYKQRVESTAIGNGVERFQSFRVHLLNTALLTEQSLGFISVAQAEMERVFGSPAPRPAAQPRSP